MEYFVCILTKLTEDEKNACLTVLAAFSIRFVDSTLATLADAKLSAPHKRGAAADTAAQKKTKKIFVTNNGGMIKVLALVKKNGQSRKLLSHR